MLTGFFEWVGLQKNVRKTVGVVCQTCQAVGVRTNEAYTWNKAGWGRSYKESHRERVICLECGRDLVKGSLVAHRQT